MMFYTRRTIWLSIPKLLSDEAAFLHGVAQSM
jgi:hypothetical protein